MERSLYEGHTTETGLNFEEPGGFGAGEPNGTAGAPRIGSADSSRADTLFPYASPGPLPDPDFDPDPEAVRGAILRLARESEPIRDSIRDSIHQPIRAGVAGDAHGTVGAAEVDGVKSFGEVARQVWERSASPYAARHDAGDAGDAGGAERQQAVALQGALAAEPERRDGDSRLHPGLHSAAAPGANEGSLRAAYQGDGRAFQPGDAEIPVETPEVLANGAGDRPALAHDACNLLSALALYSELLASPGVLGDQHRHYAEELKLMAGRSQVLIDRLLRHTAAGKVAGKDETPAIGEGAQAGVEIGTEGPGRNAASGQISSGIESELAHSRPEGRIAADLLTVAADPGTIESGSPRSSDIRSNDIRSGDVGSGGLASDGPATEVARPDDLLVIAPTSASESPSAGGGDIEDARGTSLAHLLMRWGSLLSTLARGRLEVVFGAHAAAPVPVPAESLERILVNLVRNARAATIQGGAIRIGVGTVGPKPERAETPSSAQPLGPEEAPAHSRAAAGFAAGAAPERLLGDSQTMALTVDDSGCGMTEAQIRRILGVGNVGVGNVGVGNAGVGDAGMGDADRHGLPAASVGRLPEDLRDHHQRDLGSVSLPGPEAAGQGPARRQGLGLQIVRELVAASGGSLSIQSWPGSGTRVEILWPVRILSAAEAPLAEVRVPDLHVPDLRAPDLRAPDLRVPDLRVPDLRVPDLVPEATGAKFALRNVPEPPPSSAGDSAQQSAPQPAPQTPPLAADGSSATAEAAVPVAAARAIPAQPSGAQATLTGPGKDDGTEAVGPDGFSEAELRAMMLRLHRTDPRERFPVGRSPRDWRPSEERRPGERQVDTGGADRGAEIPGSGIAGLGVLGSGLVGSGLQGPGVRAAEPGSFAGRTVKGAIAC